jgi:hypothetical protein
VRSPADPLTRVRDLRDADNHVRLAFLAEEHVLLHPRMMTLLDELETIIRQPSPERKYRLISARSYNGKSTLAETLVARYPMDMNPLGDAAHVPVVMISMPEVASVREFSIRILQAVREPVNLRWSGTHLLTCAYSCLRALGTRALILDEFQQINEGRMQDRQQMVNIVKAIGKQCGLAVFGFGMPASIKLIEDEPQLQRRFEHRLVLPWEYGVESADLIADLEALLPLRRESNLREQPALIHRILTMGDGVIGHIRAVLVRAAAAAIESKREIIDERTLDQINWLPLSERRELLESELNATDAELRECLA